jgi:hypothetical protein
VLACSKSHHLPLDPGEDGHEEVWG